MEIKKIEIRDYVLFPRTQLAGLACDDISMVPSRQDFDVAILHDVPNLGNVKLIVQQVSPYMVFQLFEPKSEQQFDDYMSKLLGKHESPAYISGCFTFMVLFQGCRDRIEVNQKNYKTVVEQINTTRDAAARWWFYYGDTF